MAYEISRKSPIGELVLNVPSAASVLLEKGFHCIGCGLAAYETVEEGASAHGFDEVAIDALVQEMKDAAKKDLEAMAKAAEKPVAKTPEKPNKKAGKPAENASENQKKTAEGPSAKAPKSSKKSKKKSKPG